MNPQAHPRPTRRIFFSGTSWQVQLRAYGNLICAGPFRTRAIARAWTTRKIASLKESS